MNSTDPKHRLKGQAALMITLSLPVTLGLTALVVDVGWSYWRQEACRTAAQAAAMAAVMQAKTASNLTCGSGVGCGANAGTYTACPSSPGTPPSNNLQAGCLYAQSNGYTAGGNSGRQNVQYAAYTSGSPVSGSSPSYWARFVVAEKIPTLFASVLNQSWMVVSARATGAVFKPASGACVYALNQTVPSAIDLKGNTDVEATCGVWDNSASSSALTCSNNTTLNAGSAAITVHGGAACSGTVTPAPTTNQPLAADPFANVPAPPDMNRCDANQINAGQAITMPSDGTFEVCGDISFKSNGSTTLPAGIYYVKNGNLDWQNGSVSGTGVTIFMTGTSPGTIKINGNMTVNLSAPTSGTYHGLVIYQDRTLANPPSHTFNGGANMNFMGSIYLPGSALKYAGGGVTAITALIADTIEFTGNSTFGVDTNGTVTGINVTTAYLIE
jgi:hypothetical protein